MIYRFDIQSYGPRKHKCRLYNAYQRSSDFTVLQQVAERAKDILETWGCPFKWSQTVPSSHCRCSDDGDSRCNGRCR